MSAQKSEPTFAANLLYVPNLSINFSELNDPNIKDQDIALAIQKTYACWKEVFPYNSFRDEEIEKLKTPSFGKLIAYLLVYNYLSNYYKDKQLNYEAQNFLQNISEVINNSLEIIKTINIEETPSLKVLDKIFKEPYIEVAQEIYQGSLNMIYKQVPHHKKNFYGRLAYSSKHNKFFIAINGNIINIASECFLGDLQKFPNKLLQGDSLYGGCIALAKGVKNEIDKIKTIDNLSKNTEVKFYDFMVTFVVKGFYKKQNTITSPETVCIQVEINEQQALEKLGLSKEVYQINIAQKPREKHPEVLKIKDSRYNIFQYAASSELGLALFKLLEEKEFLLEKDYMVNKTPTNVATISC